MAQMNRVKPKMGIMTVLTINMYLKLLTWSHSSGSWTMMKRKKQSSSALVTRASGDRWFGKVSNCGQMAAIMTCKHCPPWNDCVPNQIQATTPRTKTAAYEPLMPNEARVKTGKLTPRIQPTQPSSMAGMHTRT